MDSFEFEVPDTIICVDCGQTAHRMTIPPEDGWEAGDFVAYRCRGCNDRWDLVVEGPDDSPSQRWGGMGPDFDFRAWMEERRENGKS